MRIEVDNVSFGYGRRSNVFDRLSLTIDSGRTVGILGSSGCGKSTLLRVISGLLPRTRKPLIAGRVLLDGNAPAAALKQGRVGFVFQEPTLLPHMSVASNVALPYTIVRRKRLLPAQLAGLLSEVGLSNAAGSYPYELSTGMKTRAMLARAFSTQPELLLMDEPFVALDVAWRLKLYEDLNRLRTTKPLTTIIVSHDIHEALVLCDEVLVLGRHGRWVTRVSTPSPRLAAFDSISISQHLDLARKEYQELLRAILESRAQNS